MESQDKYLFAEARNQIMVARAERARHIGAAIVRGLQWIVEHGKRLAAAVRLNV